VHDSLLLIVSTVLDAPCARRGSAVPSRLRTRPAHWCLRAAPRLAATERQCRRFSAARRMFRGAFVPHLGACARRGSAVPPRLRTPLPRVAAPAAPQQRPLRRCAPAPGPGHAHRRRLRGASARFHAWMRLSDSACVPRLLGACSAPNPRRVRAAPRRLRAPQLGGSAAPAHAAAPPELPSLRYKPNIRPQGT
jgi:hypothetical protein